jgi:hypothetical protein
MAWLAWMKKRSYGNYILFRRLSRVIPNGKKSAFKMKKRDISASELKWIGLWRSKNISLTQAFFTYQRVLKNYNRFPSFSCKYLKKG